MIHRIHISISLLASLVFLMSGAELAAGSKPGMLCHLKKNNQSTNQVVRNFRRHKHYKHVKDTVSHTNIVKHYPPPGSGGEDRNFDWYRNRAFPNDYIDPSYYTNALEEARKLPVYASYGKNQIQSSMQ